MNRFTRRLLNVTMVLVVSAAGVVGLQSSSLAEPGGQPVTRCSSWLQVNLFRHKVCVTMDPSSSSIKHEHYIQYLGSGGATAWDADFYIINSSSGVCHFDVARSYQAGEVYDYKCYTARRTGFTYKTEGYLDYEPHNSWKGHIVSPSVTG